MWSRGRTHFPADDIWKPSRLSWIEAGIKSFSSSPPWAGWELCSLLDEVRQCIYHRAGGRLIGVFLSHLLENCICILDITSHCRWMITQQQNTEGCVCVLSYSTRLHCQASLTSVEVLWFLQFVTSFFAINSIRDNPSIYQTWFSLVWGTALARGIHLEITLRHLSY